MCEREGRGRPEAENPPRQTTASRTSALLLPRMKTEYGDGARLLHDFFEQGVVTSGRGGRHPSHFEGYAVRGRARRREARTHCATAAWRCRRAAPGSSRNRGTLPPSRLEAECGGLGVVLVFVSTAHAPYASRHACDPPSGAVLCSSEYPFVSSVHESRDTWSSLPSGNR